MPKQKHMSWEVLKEYATRFWSFVEKGEPDQCWNWQGYAMPTGYGRVCLGGKYYSAHRTAWVLANEHDAPFDAFVCHRCDNPSCVNPAHLFVGSPKDNTQDMLKKGRHRHNPNPDLAPATLTEQQVITIRQDYADGKTTYQLADEYGMTPGNISRIVRGITYARYGGPRTFVGRGNRNQYTK